MKSSQIVLFLIVSLLVPIRAADDFFPFAVWYGGGKARAPMLEQVTESSREEWRKDLETIKELGFNTVRTWVEWTAGEPRENEYRFDNLTLLLELAEEVGLKVFIQVYVDSAPDWVGEKYPEARFVAQSGEVIPSQSAPGYCFDHPGVREKILDFYRQAARIAGEYPNFLGWDVWSEPHVINWAIIDFIPNATFCYCPSSQTRFRHWLQGRYGSLDQLNQAWYRTFTNWDQVEPPRFGTILSYTDFIDWRTFIQQKLAQDLAVRMKAVKEVVPDRVVTSHAAVPSLFTSPLWGVGAPDDWLMVENVDFWGTSIYPKHSFPDRHWSLLRLSVIADFIRSSGRHRGGFYIGELQAGTGIRGTVVGDPVTEEDHLLWVSKMLSRGAKAINVYAYYPMNSGYEAGGYGLINLDGTVTPRARALGKLAAMVDRNQSLFRQAVPQKAEVAVVYNPLSHLVGGEQHLSEAGAVRDSVVGIYQAFWAANRPVDFLHLREIESGMAGSYKILFLPYSLMMTEAAAEQLKTYVERGGTLVAEARTGWNDTRGFAQPVIPGFGLDELFGVREGPLKMADEVSIVLDNNENGPTEIVGRGIKEVLVPQSSDVKALGRFADGQVAATIAQRGEGKAIMVGSFLGMFHALNPDRPENAHFVLSLAAEAGVQPPSLVQDLPEGTPIETRILEADGFSILFLFNHGQSSLQVRILAGQGSDLLNGETVDLGRVEVAPRGVRILKLTN